MLQRLVSSGPACAFFFAACRLFFASVYATLTAAAAPVSVGAHSSNLRAARFQFSARARGESRTIRATFSVRPKGLSRICKGHIKIDVNDGYRTDNLRPSGQSSDQDVVDPNYPDSRPKAPITEWSGAF